MEKEILRKFVQYGRHHPRYCPVARAQMAMSVATVKPVDFSETLTFFEGDWHSGNVPSMGPRTHAAWLALIAFDCARAFEGVALDLDRNCERVNQSAVNFKLKPV